MSSDKQHPFWDCVDGKIPFPPCDLAVGFKFVDIDRELGKLIVEFKAKPEFTNPLGIVSGGFLAAMMDSLTAATMAMTLQHNEFGPSMDLKLNFFRQAQVGRIKGIGQVVNRSRSTSYVEGQLFDIDDKLIAKGSMTSRIIRTDQEEVRERLVKGQ